MDMDMDMAWDVGHVCICIYVYTEVYSNLVLGPYPDPKPNASL